MAGSSEVDPNNDNAAQDPADVDQTIVEIRAEWDEDQQQQAAEIVVDGDLVIAAFGALPDPVIQEAQLPANGINVNNMMFVNNHGDPLQAQQIVDLQQRVTQLEQQVNAAGQNTPGVRCLYLTVAMSMVTTIAAAVGVYYAIKSNLEGNHPSSLSSLSLRTVNDLPPTDTPDVVALVNTWLKASDAAFWNNLADYVQKNSPRPFQEQLLFLQFTVDLANPLVKETWSWNPGDYNDRIKAMAQAIDQQGLSTVYRQLGNASYQSLPLPRAVAAQLMSLALNQWWVDYT